LLLRDLLDVNFDARRYCFRAADERLFDWLRANGFLNAIEEAVPEAGTLIHKCGSKSSSRLTYSS